VHELSLVADLFTIIEQQAYQAGAKRLLKSLFQSESCLELCRSFFVQLFRATKREQLPITPGFSSKWLKSNLNAGAAATNLPPEI